MSGETEVISHRFMIGRMLGEHFGEEETGCYFLLKYMLQDLQRKTAGHRHVLSHFIWLQTATGKDIKLPWVLHIMYLSSLTFVIKCPSSIGHTYWRGADVKLDLCAFHCVSTLITYSCYKKQYRFAHSNGASYRSVIVRFSELQWERRVNEMYMWRTDILCD